MRNASLEGFILRTDLPVSGFVILQAKGPRRIAQRRGHPFVTLEPERGDGMFIYPENLRAKPMLWLWELRDIGIIGVSFLLSVLALSQGIGMIPLVITVLYAFLSIRLDGSSILDFLRRAACFLFLQQQRYDWRLEP